MHSPKCSGNISENRYYILASERLCQWSTHSLSEMWRLRNDAVALQPCHGFSFFTTGGSTVIGIHKRVTKLGSKPSDFPRAASYI